MIPRTLHRLWLRPPGRVMPDEFRGYGVAWRAVLGSPWTVTDWEVLPMRLRNAAAFRAAPASCLHQFRSSLARVELLANRGGVYVDTDLQPLRPIDDLLEGAEAVVAISANRLRGRAVLSDSFLASVPGHPMLEEIMARLPAKAAAHRSHRAAIAIGPHLLDEVYRSHSWPGVRVLEPWVFYPQSIAERGAAGGRAPDLSRAYGWHRWANSRDRAARERGEHA